MKSTVFITGGTGLVGADIIRRMLRDASVDRIIALVRGNTQQALPRLVEAVQTLEEFPLSARMLEKLAVVCGDVTAEHFGWSRQDWIACARRVTHIIHSAADVRFNLSLKEARQVNLGGTRIMLDFAEQSADAGQLVHFAYVSTAYVCGERVGKISEVNTEQPRRFTNSYEQSKWECEQAVRSVMTNIPATIFRPSIIVGDSTNGRTNAFKALYAPLRLIVRDLIRSVPAADAPLDVVPVDYVSRAICHVLLSSRGRGRTLHLTAGAARSSSVAEIALRSRMAAGLDIRPVSVSSKTTHVDPASASARLTAQVLESFAAYMTQHRDFDDSNTRAALAGSGISVPAFRSYIGIIVDYCLQSEWGKRQRRAA